MYDVLVTILDELCQEAPLGYKRYYPKENEPEKLDAARSRAFIHLYLKVYYGLDGFIEREEYITDDPYDGGIDAYYIDRENKKIVFIQSKFRANQANFENKEIELEEILKMDMGRILDGELQSEEEIPYNGKINKMQRRLKEVDDIARYAYQVVILANLKKCKQSELRKLTGGFPAEVFDSELCYNRLVFPVVTGCCHTADEIRINLSLTDKESNEGRISYLVSTEYGSCKITVVFVPLLEIGKIVGEYKNAILKYNPRCFLSLKNNSINPKIQKTVTEKNTNEFALYNNGITILSDDMFINSKIAKKDTAQMIIVNPQIINGGQTAYTLSSIYENPEVDNSVFEGKEVLVKIITILDDFPKGDERLKLIEELSRATNEQTPVRETDRRSNDEIQIHYQECIFRDFGYFYNRKMGEFFDGLSKHYITRSKVIDREIFMRVATSMNGDCSKARRNSDEVLFRKEHFDEVFRDRKSYRAYMFGFFCHQYLMKLDKQYAKSSNNAYGENQYGNALRYGKYAVVYAVSRFYDENMPFSEYEIQASLFVNLVLDQWCEFEEQIRRKSSNQSYFRQILENEILIPVYNYDGYYKGRTVNRDIADYNFDAGIAAAEAAAVTE